MPRTIDLPEEPKVVFTVFNRFNRPPISSNTDSQYYGPYRVGWTVYPFYGFGTPPLSSRDTAEQALADQIARWRTRVRARKAQNVTMKEVLEGRTILRIEPKNFSHRFYFSDGTYLELDRTRGWSRASLEGPLEGPMTVKRVLTNQRSIRLEDGRSLEFGSKVDLDRAALSDDLLDQIIAG